MQLKKNFILLALMLSSFAFMGCPKPAEVVPEQSVKPTENVKPVESVTPTESSKPVESSTTPTSNTSTSVPSTPIPSSSTTTIGTNTPLVSSLIGQTYGADLTLIGGGTTKAFITYDSLNQSSILVNFNGIDEKPTLVEALDIDGNVIGSSSSFNLAAFSGNIQFTISSGKYVFKIRLTHKGTKIEGTFTKDPKMTVIKPTPMPTSTPSTTTSTGGSSSGGSSSTILNPTPVPLNGTVGGNSGGAGTAS